MVKSFLALRAIAAFAPDALRAGYVTPEPISTAVALPRSARCRIVRAQKFRGENDGWMLADAGSERACVFDGQCGGCAGAVQLSRSPGQNHRPDWSRRQLRSGRPATRRR